MNRVDEFLNGGDSNFAKYGRLFGTGINFTAKWGAMILIVLVLVAVGQLGQYMISIKDIRNQAIEKWVVANPSEKNLADRFVAECVIGKLSSDRDMDTKIVSVYECGESIGANNLVSAVKAADETMVSTAWPLSLIN